jgi:hypothetical protein
LEVKIDIASRGPEHEIFCTVMPTLTLFYTRGLGIVVLHVMDPKPYRIFLCFLTLSYSSTKNAVIYP